MNNQSFKYVLDSDTFIRASRTHYPFDFAMPFWDALLKYAELGIICSIDKVAQELVLGKDDLANWAGTKFSQYFLNTETQEVLDNYATLIGWVQDYDQFNQDAKDEFYELNNADPWLMAFALTNKLTIVTHEVFNPNIKRKVPIPNVCNAFNIPYIDLYKLLRNLNFHF